LLTCFKRAVYKISLTFTEGSLDYSELIDTFIKYEFIYSYTDLFLMTNLRGRISIKIRVYIEFSTQKFCSSHTKFSIQNFLVLSLITISNI